MENKEARKMTKQAKVYSAWINGVSTQLKAYNILHAHKGFKQMDPNIKLVQVSLTTFQNSHQAVWDEKQQ